MLNRPDNNFSAPAIVQNQALQTNVANPGNYFGHTPNANQEEVTNNFDVLKLFWYVIRHRWLIGAILFSGILAGIIYTEMQTPKYRASLTLELLANSTKIFRELEVTQQSRSQAMFSLATALRKLQSRNLARRVVHKLNLTEKPDFLITPPGFSPRNLINKAFGIKPNIEAFKNMSASQRERRAIAYVRGGLTAVLVRRTSLVNISFSHSSKQYVHQVANAAAEAFIEQSQDQGSQASTEAKQFLEEQVSATKEKLQVSEKSLNDYAKEQGITVTGDELSLVGESIKSINTALSQSVQDRLEAERLVAQINAGNGASLPDVLDSEAIAVTKTKISELRATYQEKLSTLKPGFPEMRRLRAQISELGSQLNREIAVISNSVKIKFSQAKLKEADLRQELEKLEKDQIAFQDKNIQYTILKREVDSNRKQYDALINKLNQIDVGAEIKTANAAVIDAATPAGRPYSPRRFVNVAVMFLISLVIAGIVVYILELLNNTFSTPDQVESELNLPILGIIPFVEDDDIETELADERSALSEAYRTLRTSIQFTGIDGYVRSLMVTSSEPSEGKSTTVTKLAADFASLGIEVLVIDADMRKPKLHRNFGRENRIGLSNLLTNVIDKGNIMDLFQKTSIPGVTFLSAGTIPPNPADLLASHKMAKVVELCGKKYGMVIIDAPPVMGISDAPILARHAESVVFVVATKQSSRKSAHNAMKRLAAAGANVIGVAMTKFVLDKVDYKYSYQYMDTNYFTYAEEPKALTSDVTASASEAKGAKNENSLVPAFITNFRRRTG